MRVFFGTLEGIGRKKIFKEYGVKTVMASVYKTKTKSKIMHAAWKLFREKGYEETTISDILKESETSRSAFYHHFHGKDELLFTLAYSYDEFYEEWQGHTDPSLSAINKLKSFNEFCFNAVENSAMKDLYPHLYGLQVCTDGVRHILNHQRRYYQIQRELIKEGQQSGELTTSKSYAELTNILTSFQIGLCYSWCLQKEVFSLVDYGMNLLNPFLDSLKA